MLFNKYSVVKINGNTVKRIAKGVGLEDAHLIARKNDAYVVSDITARAILANGKAGKQYLVYRGVGKFYITF